MKLLSRLYGFLVLFAWVPLALGQFSAPKIARIDIKHVGPASVSDDLIRANIHVKVGDPYVRDAADDDVHNLYATGLFYNIRVTQDTTDEGVVLTFIVQANPRLTGIDFQGNTKFSNSKLMKKISSKIGEPLDERKLFTDSLEIQKTYQKAGYPGTEVKYVLNIDENAGRGTATFEIKESPKVKIREVDFVGAQVFSQKKLRKVIKTRRHHWYSSFTSSGVFKDDQFEDDKDALRQFYYDHGYIDFEIKDVKFEYPTPKSMVIRIYVYEGTQYKVGAVTFQGTSVFPTNAINPDFDPGPEPKPGPAREVWYAGQRLHRGFIMKVGSTFTPEGLSTNMMALQNFYGAIGYIDVAQGGHIRVRRIPNTETGTMDLDYQIDEGRKSYIEKIEIRGNTKTKDRVIRRELAVAPGEVFDMTRVDLSQKRLEGLNYFDKVNMRPEATDVPDRKNLIVGVDEKNTGNFTLGAGFSSVDSLVGFAEITQGNFDLFNPPTFTGGGQKIRLRVQLGTQRQDYEVSFVEPWFLGRKLSLGVDLYHRELDFQSVNNLYSEQHTGGRISLTRALGSDFLIGGINYTFEDVDIILNNGVNASYWDYQGGPPPIQVYHPATAPNAILNETGNSLISQFGVSLAYDTRNNAQLPTRGQRTELTADFAGGPFGGDHDFYKLELKTHWYFRGLFSGHVLELLGSTGVADGFNGDTVPFYERFYLGGLYTLRGFGYREISPREAGFTEPVGGNTYWFGSAEYSLPIIERLRFAVFYDVGAVQSSAYSYDFSNYSDNWGVGLRLNLPIGPLRLDYGIPIHHDQYSGSSGKFQFGVGFDRPF